MRGDADKGTTWCCLGDRDTGPRNGKNTLSQCIMHLRNLQRDSASVEDYRGYLEALTSTPAGKAISRLNFPYFSSRMGYNDGGVEASAAFDGVDGGAGIWEVRWDGMRSPSMMSRLSLTCNRSSSRLTPGISSIATM